MIKIDENKSIHITRGDSTNELNQVKISYEDYIFKPGDTLKLNVMDKKGYAKEIILQKKYTVEEESNEFEIQLTSEDTSKFQLENKKQKYWYEIVLNENTTIIGYDEEGAKDFIVYPGGVFSE